MTSRISSQLVPWAPARGAVEGHAYGVPLPSGYATVVVARVAPKGGVTLGYFFGPRAPSLPDVGSLKGLQRNQATLILQFGDLGIVEGTWPRIGRMAGTVKHIFGKRRSRYERGG